MKKFRVATAIIACAVLSVSGYAFQATPTQSKAQKAPAKAAATMQTFVGVITDGQCAVKGSKKEVMQKAKVKTKKIYKLSDQERPAELAAKRVKIKGALDKATQTIYVSSIEPVL